MQRDKTARYIYEQSQKDIERINREIKEVERKMPDAIGSSEELQENYSLVTSVK